MPRWEPHARGRLYEAALDLFEAQGYESTTVADIAHRAGLTKTTFFRHFADKREVLFGSQDAQCDLLASTIADSPPDATPLECVAAALHALTTLPTGSHDVAVRWHNVVTDHRELQERAGFQQAGYVTAMIDALEARSVPAPAAVVAADLGRRAFVTAFDQWTDGDSSRELSELTRRALTELHATALTLT